MQRGSFHSSAQMALRRLRKKTTAGVTYDILREPRATSTTTSSSTLATTRERHVPVDIARPDYTNIGARALCLKTSRADQQAIRDAGRLAADALSYAGSLLRPGLSTVELDRRVHEWIVLRKAYPSPLHYHGFPRSICTSVNNIICHGIPDDRELLATDLVSVDITVYRNGFHGDTCRTFAVQPASLDPQGQRLIDVAKASMMAGIGVCAPGVSTRAIGRAIMYVVSGWWRLVMEAHTHPRTCRSDTHTHTHTHTLVGLTHNTRSLTRRPVRKVARAAGYSSVREYCGHGIGRSFHELPYIYHYDHGDEEEQDRESQEDDEVIMEPGMTFTVEPMLCERAARLVTWSDGWTNATADHGRCAQFEHTLLITDHGHEILTSYGDE